MKGNNGRRENNGKVRFGMGQKEDGKGRIGGDRQREVRNWRWRP